MPVKSVSIISALTVAFCVAAAISSTSAAPDASIPLRRHDSIRIIQFRANMTLPEMMPRADGGLVPLHDYMNAEYFAPLQVGTPPKSFMMIYDTGSSDVWVPERNCIGCNGTYKKTTYDAHESSTSKPDGSSFSIQYGSGPVSGYNVYDTVTFGNVSVPNYDFASITDASGLGKMYTDTPHMDGIVGLAFPKIAQAPHHPLVLEAHNRNLLKEPIFSIYLGRKSGQDGTIDFGAIDHSKYHGELRYIPVIEELWWTVTLTSVAIDDKSVTTARKAIVDSGTSLLVGPTSDVENLAQALGAENTFHGIYTMNCSAMTGRKPLLITLNKTAAFEIPMEALIFEKFGDTCVLGISGMDFGTIDPMWILGDVFMREYFTVFDYDQKRIGFAKALLAPNAPDYPFAKTL